MAYDSQVVRAARDRLERRRREAETTAAALREEWCTRIPRLREIERNKAAAIPELTRFILAGDSAAIEGVRQNNLRLQQEILSLAADEAASAADPQQA